MSSTPLPARLGAAALTAGRAAVTASAPPPQATGAASERTLVTTYCFGCHNAATKSGGIQLDAADPSDVSHDPRLWERVARAVGSEIMPPAGRPAPAAAERRAFVASLEGALDRVATAQPNPGRTTIHRLNRTEYGNAVRDLFGLEIDVRAWLPGDNTDTHGFDNNADVLSLSPLLMERYLSAARRVAAAVIGQPAGPDFQQVRIHKWLKQDERLSDDLPFGSRGGIAIPYYFPADGDYVVKLLLHRTTNDHIKGLGADHLLDVRVDDALVKRFTVGGDHWVQLAPPENYSSNIRMSDEWEDYSHNMEGALEVKFPAKAGQRVIGVSFVEGQWAPEGVIQPQVGVSFNRNEIPDGNPSVASVAISGLFAARRSSARSAAAAMSLAPTKSTWLKVRSSRFLKAATPRCCSRPSRETPRH